MIADLDPTSYCHHDVPDSTKEHPHHKRLEPGEHSQMKSDFEISKDKDYLRNNSECFMFQSSSFKEKSSSYKKNSTSF